MYDYLIVGAGLFGATFARLMTDAGRKCLVIEKRPYVGGNCADHYQDGILVNRHGGHIFHTNSDKVWHFVNCYAPFWNYRHRVAVNHDGRMYSFPINLQTFAQMFSAQTPDDARREIKQRAYNAAGDNLEAWCLRQVGPSIYETFIKGYTEKQWGCKASELPSSIVRRIPIRYTWNDDYFSDEYQGMPIGGYTAMIEAMLTGIQVVTSTDYFQHREQWDSNARQVVYTGPLDKLYSYNAGTLEYRSLRWHHETHEGDYQGVATVNYTAANVPYTRVIEWKHFMYKPEPTHTVISREYPQRWERGRERYYPVNNDKNNAMAHAYKQRAKRDGILLGGRLATYRYFDMDQVVASAMKLSERCINGS